MNDPLSNFLRKTSQAAEVATVSKQPDEYVAFETKDRVSCLMILRARQQVGQIPPYQLQINTYFSGPGITQIVLAYSFQMIFIKGKNLHPLLMAFSLQTASVIQEFDPARYRKPTDPNATIIESIEVKCGEKGPGLLEAEKWCGLEQGSLVH